MRTQQKSKNYLLHNTLKNDINTSQGTFTPSISKSEETRLYYLIAKFLKGEELNQNQKTELKLITDLYNIILLRQEKSITPIYYSNDTDYTRRKKYNNYIVK